MIRNIIFDMGNVLLRFDRGLFLDRLDVSEEDRALLLREVFVSLEWAQMDRGSLTEATALERMCRRLPQRLHAAAEALVCRWDDPILPMEGMYALVEELKAAGYGIYLLSNASVRQHDYWPRLPVSRFFDGTLISADEGLVKPQPEIYRLLMERFERCDDRRALFASYLAKYGDDRALPALRRAAEDPQVNYLDFVEISSAIEALGGERPAEREFAGDPYYESLKHV